MTAEAVDPIEEWKDEQTSIDVTPTFESVTEAPEEHTGRYPVGLAEALSRMTRIEPERQVTPLPVVFPEGEILDADHAADWLARHRDQAFICWRVRGRTFRLFRGGDVTELLDAIGPVSVCSISRRCGKKDCPMCIAVSPKRRRWWHWFVR